MRQFAFCLIIIALFLSTAEPSERSRQEYLELIKRHPKLVGIPGNASKGEIEIITDKASMACIEKKMQRDVGVIARDNYWIWINDACRFPSGRQGIYARILSVDGLNSPPKVAIMPITQEGKIVLNCNYRHATRSWEIELPRGAVNAGETIEEAAKRKAQEETGMVLEQLTLLGNAPPNSGMISHMMPIYTGVVTKKERTCQEYSEAIEQILALTAEEIKQAFASGFHLCKIRGEWKKIPCRDPFLAFALMLFELKNNQEHSNHLSMFDDTI